MIYASVPEDLSNVKTKILFGLTKRQLVCFGAGALVGLPVFFLLKNTAGSSAASMSMILLMLPFFLLALYEKNGKTLEVILRDVIRFCFFCPKKRIYQTNNFYTCLHRQAQFEKEVQKIVFQNQQPETDPKRTKTNPGCR